MKRLLCLFLSFFIFPAFAVTSESYVDATVNTLQNEIPAVNTNTVLINTGTPGEIGTKKIYDETQSFAMQNEALVTAETFNSAMQNAIDNEYVCIEWLGEHVPGNCLLWQIQNKMPQQTLPSTYTQLEYLESTGKQYLDLGQPIGSGENITTKFEYTTNTAGIWFGARDGTSTSIGFVFDFYSDAYKLFIIANSDDPTRTIYRGYYTTNLVPDTQYILNWYGNPFQPPVLSNNVQISKYSDINHSNYLVTPPYNAFLFAYNRGGNVNSKKPMRIYYFTVHGKMNLWPARRNSDGVLGMYDMVSGTFFTNAGTGEFIAGPDVVSNLYLPSGH